MRLKTVSARVPLHLVETELICVFIGAQNDLLFLQQCIHQGSPDTSLPREMITAQTVALHAPHEGNIQHMNTAVCEYSLD